MLTTKTQALVQGQKTRERLVRVAKKACNAKITDSFPHTYIYSPPGLGKTFTVNSAIQAAGKEYYEVSGTTSMFAFGVRLAVLNYTVPQDRVIIVSVDDCDEILKNEQNCNIMKNILSGAKSFQYEKSLQSQWNGLKPLQVEAIQAHMKDEAMGFVVPTHRMIFIFTSNTELPDDDQVREAKSRNQAKATLMGHRNAIRSRCNTIDFDLDQDTHWGWIADVVLNTTALQTTSEQKEEILDYLYDNWEDMKERSIRTVEKMADIMLQDPDDYEESWNIQMLK